jgi:CheY-like chemotaxis protein
MNESGMKMGERHTPIHCAEARALRLLVVDDNADGAASTALLLELQGHTLRIAHSGLEAIAAVPEFQPQVVILDISLPDISGYEVARRLRASLAQATPRLIALTGWGSEDDRRRARAAGFDAHLVKPVDPEELNSRLTS